MLNRIIKTYGARFLEYQIPYNKYWTMYGKNTLNKLEWFRKIIDAIGVNFELLDKNQIISIENIKKFTI